MTTPRPQSLPPNLPPRGLSRTEAAAYLGIGAGTFDKLVKDGAMPQAKKMLGRLVWDRIQLDKAFESLPDVDGRAQTKEDMQFAV